MCKKDPDAKVATIHAIVASSAFQSEEDNTLHPQLVSVAIVRSGMDRGPWKWMKALDLMQMDESPECCNGG